MSIKRIGILGGTFDPIHKGHLALAKNAKDALNLHEVWLEPNKIPYYKNPHTTDEHRLNMVKLAITANKGIIASDIELNMPQYLSTFETISLLCSRFPTYDFTFIMGMDSFLALDKWRNGKEIIKLANICVFNRPQYKLNPLLLPELQQELLKNAINLDNHSMPDTALPNKSKNLYLLTGEENDISSSAIRKSIKNAQYQTLSTILSDKVLRYIKDHNLYQEESA